MLFRRKSLAGSWQRLRRVCSPGAEASGRCMRRSSRMAACDAAQQPAMPLIGFLSVASSGACSHLRAAFLGLREAGYIDLLPSRRWI
jgi:hypothetical protein